MPFKNNRQMHIYRAILAVLVIAVSVLHTTPSVPILSSFYAFIPLVICLGLFERELSGALYGALAGIIYDISSPLPDGFNAIFFCLMGFACGLLVRYILRNNLVSALILTVFFGGLYTLFRCIFLRKIYGEALKLFSPLALTALFLPVFYLLIRYISKYFKTSDDLDKI
ncbi:MAG: hypothetical protein GXY95_02495 [Clostridiales bacterium]|mgnify:FL=1|nr:hypothetical protein [Clostridiales bacterium]HOJ35766.1 hypothetical protein [Clostridiales bacterium]HOL79836.1 hypothetical protein [Clostridiales bacterium]HPU68048.1 hypothetical protein [Clostridiales bacterium]HXK84305.1 hypothetical protein [Clostridiales bacterium]